MSGQSSRGHGPGPGVDPHSVAGKTPAVERRVPLVVVGGGPAGLAAATEAARAGVEVLLVDEHPLDPDLMAMDVPLLFGQRLSAAVRDQGQALARQVQASPALEAAVEAGADVQLGVMAWGAFRPGPTVGALPGPCVGLADRERSWLVAYDQLVVATGARDLGMAFPGWDKAGTMGAAGALALLSRYRALSARRLVVLGSGPLGLAVAAAALDQGVEVLAVVDVTREARGDPAARADLERRGVRFHLGHAVREARGARDEVEGVVLVALDADLAPVAGRTVELACDTLCLAVGLVPSVELPEVLGCRLAYRPERGGWVPEADAWQRTSVPGVLVAGDGAGVDEAAILDPDPARAAGRRAGLVAAVALGAVEPDGAWARRAGASAGGEPPPSVLPYRRAWLRAHTQRDPDVLVCLCEEVTRRELQGVQPPRYLGWRSAPMEARSARTLAADGPVHPDQIKRLTRAGMGPCQGRRCREQVALLLAEATGAPPEAVPLATYRPPIRPLPLSVLWPHDEPAEVRERWVSWFGIPTQFAPHWAGPPEAVDPATRAGGVTPDK